MPPAHFAAGGLPVTVFSGVQPNPTTGDVAAGADAVAALAAGGGRPAGQGRTGDDDSLRPVIRQVLGPVPPPASRPAR